MENFKQWMQSNYTHNELADIANQVKPKLLILNHQLTFGTTLQSLLEEVKSKYKGAVVNGADLDVY